LTISGTDSSGNDVAGGVCNCPIYSSVVTGSCVCDDAAKGASLEGSDGDYECKCNESITAAHTETVKGKCVCKARATGATQSTGTGNRDCACPTGTTWKDDGNFSECLCDSALTGGTLEANPSNGCMCYSGAFMNAANTECECFTGATRAPDEDRIDANPNAKKCACEIAT